MNYCDRLVTWWWRLRNGHLADSIYPIDSSPPSDMRCPDTRPTSPGALDSDADRVQ